MKISLFVIATLLSTGAFAIEPAAPQKTELNTKHADAACKSKKDCAQTTSAPSIRH